MLSKIVKYLVELQATIPWKVPENSGYWSRRFWHLNVRTLTIDTAYWTTEPLPLKSQSCKTLDFNTQSYKSLAFKAYTCGLVSRSQSCPPVAFKTQGCKPLTGVFKVTEIWVPLHKCKAISFQFWGPCVISLWVWEFTLLASALQSSVLLTLAYSQSLT